MQTSLQTYIPLYGSLWMPLVARSLPFCYSFIPVCFFLVGHSLLLDFFPTVKCTQAQQAFLTQPRNVTVRAGAKAQLHCQVLRATGLVQWVKDGLLLGPQRNLPGFPRHSIVGDEKRGETF